MTAGRIYIPRNTICTGAETPAVEPRRSVLSEAIAGASFIFLLAATIGAFSLMLALG